MNKCLFLFIPLFAAACGGSTDYVIKPHAYPKMELPDKQYVLFDCENCPYKFEIPVYSKMLADTTGNLEVHPAWYNMNFPSLNATLHLTYHNFKNWETFDSLIADSRKLVNKHLQKADDIVEVPIQTENPAVKGLVFRILGNTATNYNFYITDSTRHFLRGALYFNNKTEQDSIMPAYEFIRKDIEHLIKTTSWK